MGVYTSVTASNPPPNFNRTDALSVTNNAAAGKVTSTPFGQTTNGASVSDMLTKDYASIQQANDARAAIQAGKQYAGDFLLAADYSGLSAGEAREALQGALKGAGLDDDQVHEVLSATIVSSIADDTKVDAEKFFRVASDAGSSSQTTGGSAE